MNRRRLAKFLLVSGGLVMAALAGAGISQYLTNPPLADLSDVKYRYSDREESRMPVVEVFFVTNRKPAKEGEFTEQAAESLSFGIAQIRMPANLRVGDVQMPEIPRNQLDNRRAVVLEVTTLSEQHFRNALSKRLTHLNSRTFDLFVHGINHTFDSALRQAGTLTFELDMPQPMVVFAWPTMAGILPANYERDLAQVKAASHHLAGFLEAFQRGDHSQHSNINVLAHSLGCKVLCETFDFLVRSAHWNDQETEFANVVLAAPDVNREDFDKTFMDDMSRLSKRLTVYVSRTDGVLALSSFLNGRPRAGEFKQKELHVEGLFVSDSREAPHIQIVDATFVNNVLTAHSYFYQSRPAFSDLYSLLRNDLPAEERHVLRHEKAGQANYWILRP